MALDIVMLSVSYAECQLSWVSVMLSVSYAECHKKPIMLCVIMINVIMLSVVAPSRQYDTLSDIKKSFYKVSADIKMEK